MPFCSYYAQERKNPAIQQAKCLLYCGVLGKRFFIYAGYPNARLACVPGGKENNLAQAVVAPVIRFLRTNDVYTRQASLAAGPYAVVGFTVWVFRYMVKHPKIVGKFVRNYTHVGIQTLALLDVHNKSISSCTSVGKSAAGSIFINSSGMQSLSLIHI